MNPACELTEGKIMVNVDLANEGSPARLVDSMWEAGNKKSSFFEIAYNILLTNCLTKIFSREILFKSGFQFNHV